MSRQQSEETKKKLSIAGKGRPAWNKGIKRWWKSPTEFKKGHINWLKGTNGIHQSLKTEFKKGQNIGEENNEWKGKNVGYFALHSWIKRKLGKAKKCINCGKTNKVQWANKSFEYKRDINDWLSLCYWCHRKYDRRYGWGLATRKYHL